MSKQTLLRLTCSAALLVVVSAMAACGGGSSTPDPQPVKTALQGKLQQDPTTNVAAGGSFIGSASATLLRGSTVEAAVMTDSSGNFEFDDIAAGSYTLRVQFDGTVDLDEDGDNDTIIVNLPLTIVADTINIFNTTFIGVDIDLDGDLDSIDISSLLTDNKGRSIKRLIRLFHKLGKIQVDEDNDGDFDDEDVADDEDNDGVPDGPGSGNSLNGGILRGEIEAKTGSSITVAGIVFEVNSSTEFKIRGNKNVDLDDFDVGDMVHVRARWSGQSWIALVIKSSGPGNGGGGGQDPDTQIFHGELDFITSSSFSIQGRSFSFDSQTDWVISGNVSADSSDFRAGDFVLVLATETQAGWEASKVILIRAGDGGGPITQEFSGTVSALSATSITVGGQVIQLNAQTDWLLESGSIGLPADFAIGDRVTVTAQQSGSVWIALEVQLDEDLSPETDTFTGLISALLPASLTVGGQLIVYGSATLWKNEDGSAAGPPDFQIGDEVSVEAQLSGTVWTAVSVTMLSDNTPGTETFSGLIDLITPSSIRLSSGLTFVINTSTSYENSGGSPANPLLFDADDFVSIEARLQGEMLIAVSITLLEDEPVLQTVSGIIESISSSSLTLHGGASFSLDADTQLTLPGGDDVEFELFDLGDFVTIRARQSGEAWIAVELELSDDEPLIEHFTAAIGTISSSLITLGSNEFVVDAVTHFMFEDGSDAEFSLFDAGDLVMIEARQEGEVWHALHVSFIDDNDSAPVVSVFEGSVSAITEFSLTAGGQVFTVDASTKWYLADGSSGDYLDFSLDDEVQVIAEQNGLLWTALRVDMQ